MPNLSFAVDARKTYDALRSASLESQLRAAGLEARGGVPSPQDPLGEFIHLKNVSKKLVLVENYSTQHFLEPGETVILAPSPELRATPLNNGV